MRARWMARFTRDGNKDLNQTATFLASFGLHQISPSDFPEDVCVCVSKNMDAWTSGEPHVPVAGVIFGFPIGMWFQQWRYDTRMT